MIKIVFSLKSFVFHIWFCNPSEFFWCDVRYDSFLFHINFFSMTYQYWYWFVLWPLSYTKFIVHFLSFCVCLIGLFLLFLKSHCLKYSPVILSQDYISFFCFRNFWLIFALYKKWNLGLACRVLWKIPLWFSHNGVVFTFKTNLESTGFLIYEVFLSMIIALHFIFSRHLHQYVFENFQKLSWIFVRLILK